MNFRSFLFDYKIMPLSKFAAIIGVIAGIASITRVIFELTNLHFNFGALFEIPTLGFTNHLIHILFISIILFSLNHLCDDSNEKLNQLRNNFKEISNPNLRQKGVEHNEEFAKRKEIAYINIESFSSAILWFWYSLLILYLILIVKDFIGKSEFAKMVLNKDFITIQNYNLKQTLIIFYNVVLTFTNNCGCLAIYFAFLLCARFIESEKGINRYYPLFKLGAIVILFSVAQLIGYIIISNLIHRPHDPHANCLTSDMDMSIKYTNLIFECISGILQGLTLCLLFARLDDKFFNIKTKLVFILYGYAIIQPLYCLFNLPNESNIIKAIVVSILYVALIMKFFFYFLFVWLYKTGRVHNYFLFYPTLSEYIKRNWKDL